MKFTLTGDDTYAGIVFTPPIVGVAQVEVTLRYSDDPTDKAEERSFSLADHESAEAYTRWLIAAPEMLAALEQVAADVDAYGDGLGTPQTLTLDDVRAAIAKATR